MPSRYRPTTDRDFDLDDPAVQACVKVEQWAARRHRLAGPFLLADALAWTGLSSVDKGLLKARGRVGPTRTGSWKDLRADPDP